MRCGIYVRVSTDEMIFGMNLVFGQRERKEIGARTKRALEKVYPAKAPYAYIRNSETGHLKIEPIEAQVVKRIFELYKNGASIRSISNTLNEEQAYLRQGKWNSDKVIFYMLWKKIS